MVGRVEGDGLAPGSGLGSQLRHGGDIVSLRHLADLLHGEFKGFADHGLLQVQSALSGLHSGQTAQTIRPVLTLFHTGAKGLPIGVLRFLFIFGTDLGALRVGLSTPAAYRASLVLQYSTEHQHINTAASPQMLREQARQETQGQQNCGAKVQNPIQNRNFFTNKE